MTRLEKGSLSWQSFRESIQSDSSAVIRKMESRVAIHSTKGKRIKEYRDQGDEKSDQEAPADVWQFDAKY